VFSLSRHFFVYLIFKLQFEESRKRISKTMMRRRTLTLKKKRKRKKKRRSHP